jgi:hypothetical protein
MGPIPYTSQAPAQRTRSQHRLLFLEDRKSLLANSLNAFRIILGGEAWRGHGGEGGGEGGGDAVETVVRVAVETVVVGGEWGGWGGWRLVK